MSIVDHSPPRGPMTASEPEPTIVVDFAERFPPALVDDYIALRNWWYGQRLGLMGDVVPRDAFDSTSHIVLAVAGEQCVGGVRATVCHPSSPRQMPMEALCPGLVLRTLFHELPLDTVAHVEFSKLVVARRDGPHGHRNDIARRLFGFLWGPDNPRPEVRYAFSFATTASNRLYRALARANDLHWEARPVPPGVVPADGVPVGPFSVQSYVLDAAPAEGRSEP